MSVKNISDEVLEHRDNLLIQESYKQNQDLYIKEIKANMKRLRESHDTTAQLRAIYEVFCEMGWRAGGELVKLGLPKNIHNELCNLIENQSDNL